MTKYDKIQRSMSTFITDYYSLVRHDNIIDPDSFGVQNHVIFSGLLEVFNKITTLKFTMRIPLSTRITIF